MKKRLVVEREVEVEEFGEWVAGMDMNIECELRVELTSYKCAKLSFDVSILKDIYFLVVL